MPINTLNAKVEIPPGNRDPPTPLNAYRHYPVIGIMPKRVGRNVATY